ncbi:MAG: hypothetical protein FWC71_11800 [Defluviitaleaceae bacterium]|nr:hypothetical protein [Defluviitaleaceae bacterium]
MIGKKCLTTILIALMCCMFFASFLNATEAPTGVSIESLQRIQPGMTRQEVNDIIGHGADVTMSPANFSFRDGISFMRINNTWSDGGPFPLGTVSTSNVRITVSFVDDWAYQTTAWGFPGALDYTFRYDPMNLVRSLRPSAPSTPFIQTEAFIWLAFTGVVLLIIAIPFLYNQTRPVLIRRASVSGRRIGWTRQRRLYLQFRIIDTGESAEFRVPWFDKDLFETVNIGDEGDLTTRGFRLQNFIRTRLRGARNTEVTPTKAFQSTSRTNSTGSIFRD